jgi:hypothetical protein|tara:strand:+ start:1710 stop:1928 length:219 start_codon:yes stop_codon:yes gene_type:complete
MKNLIYLSTILFMVSCGTVNEENENQIIITQPVISEDVVDTTINTFDPSGISNVQDLLDTLSKLPEGTVIEE